jgi:hypothetical protein
MGFEIRNTEDAGTGGARLDETLDICLARIGAGEALAAVLADYPADAAALAPLLAQAAAVAESRVPPAPAATNLAIGRARFLEAAQRAQAADAAAALPAAAVIALDDSSLTDALDEALTRVRAGESSERVMGAYPGILTALAPLLATAGSVASGGVVAPAPPHGLNPGRARFLTAAAELRIARDAAPVGMLARLGAILGLRSGQRLALGALASVLFFLVLSGAVSTAAADALPGDALYGVKRLGEQLRWALSFSPDARAAAALDVSQERAEELTGLVAAGRVAELGWEARLLRIERGADGTLRLIVAPLGAAAGSEIAVTWTDATRFDLGPLPASDDPLGTLGELEPGATLFLQVATDGQGPPRLVFGRILGSPQLANLPQSPVAPVAPDAPATSEPNDTPPPEPTQTLSPTQITPTRTVRPTLAATAQPTPSPSAAPATAPAPEEETPDEVVRLNGTLAAKIDDVTWQVADNDQGGRVILVDVSRVPAALRNLVSIGDTLLLIGHWTDRAAGRFEAELLPNHHAPTCAEGQALNRTITRLTTGISFTVSGEAGEFWFTSDSQVVGVLSEGMAVDLRYRRCDTGRQEVIFVAPAVTQVEEIRQGVVEGLDMAAGTFRLPSEGITVRFDPQTEIRGVAQALKDGQQVEVTGTIDPQDPTVLVARLIIILRDAAASAPSQQDPPTAEPLPSPTPFFIEPTALPPSLRAIAPVS